MTNLDLQKHLRDCRPWIAARAPLAAAIAKSFDGELQQDLRAALSFAELQHFDPTKLASVDFIHVAQQLQIQEAASLGMPMEPWVSYDCGLFPGMMCGMAMPAEQLPIWLHRVLQVPNNYAGFLPVSSMTLTPMLQKDAWQLLNLASLNQVSPASAPAGLKRISLLMLGGLLNRKTIFASSRWRSPLISAAASLMPIDILGAWTPAQDILQMATFCFRPGPDWNAGLLVNAESNRSSGADLFVDVDDDEALQALQEDIESGHHVHALAAPIERALHLHFPIKIQGEDSTFIAQQRGEAIA